MDWDKVRLTSNIFVSFVGAGILGLPYAFRKSGISSINLLVNARKLLNSFQIDTVQAFAKSKSKFITNDSF
jgi:hypothetical protein